MPRLHLLSPASLPRVGSELHFDVGSVTLGSGPPADLVLREPSVSRLHARISRHEDGFVIEDLGSANGVFLGPHRLAVCEVGFRQLFRIGRVALELLPDVTVDIPRVKPSEPPAVAIEPLPLAFTDRFPTSKRVAWLVSSTAAVVTAVLFGALHLTLGARRVATQEAVVEGATRLLTLPASDVSRQVRLDANWDLSVPSAAVTAPLGISVAPLAHPRGPKTRLLAPAGPGIWVEFTEPAPHAGLQAKYTAPTERGILLLGRYRLDHKHVELFEREVPIHLVGARELLVPLRLGTKAKMRRVDDWNVIYEERARMDADPELRELGLRLARLRSSYREFGYAIQAPEPIVVLDSDAFDESSWCASFLSLPSRHEDWTQAVLERAYFATVLGRRVDCSAVAGRGSVMLESVFRALASVESQDTSLLERGVQSVRPIGLFVRDSATEDHTSKFFTYLARSRADRARWFSAMETALVQRSSPRRMGSKEQLMLLDDVAKWTGHSSLSRAWSDYVGHLALPSNGVLGFEGHCRDADVVWQPDPVVLRARPGCFVRAEAKDNAPRRQRR